MKRNMVYESECGSCNPPGSRKEADKKSLAESKGYPSLYVGESSRSLYERSREHHRDMQDRSEDSHQVKHWILDHPDLSSPPKFRYKIVSGFKDALTRQVAESVRIERAGPNILNSKSEFSRCRIPRLKIDMEGWKMKQDTKKNETRDKNLENEDDEALGSLEEEARIQAEKAQERQAIQRSVEGRLTKEHQKELDVRAAEKAFIEDKLKQGEKAREELEKEKLDIQAEAERLLKEKTEEEERARLALLQ